MRRTVPMNEALDDHPYYKADRMLYRVVIPQKKPITTLTTDWNRFYAAFFSLFYCHAMLWSVGIRHCDISEENLMYDPVTDKPRLCDFDFSHLRHENHTTSAEPTGFSNTGTWIFMATDLLTIEAMDGLIKRVYRHEVEAFIAVLVWMVCRFERGKLRVKPPFAWWNQASFERCNSERQNAFNRIRVAGTMYKPESLQPRFWKAIVETLWDLVAYQNDCKSAESRQHRYERNPNSRKAVRPEIHPDEYNTLRALPRMLEWDLFQIPSADKCVKLLTELIAHVPSDDAATQP